MGETTDRRIRKTKQAVHGALLTLMKEKTISEISVLELTRLADINRKTFYNHYSDIYAVLDEIEDDCVDRIVGLLDEGLYNQYSQDPSLFFRRLISELHENEFFYLLLDQTQAHSRISQKLILRIKGMLRNLMDSEHLNETWVEYFLSFISAGVTSVLNTWFVSDRRIPVESLADFFNVLFSASDVRRYIEAARL